MSFVPFFPRSMFVEPFAPSGFTPSGIEIRTHHPRLAMMYARVLKVHPTCTFVRPDDFVVYPRKAPIRLRTTDNEILWVLYEWRVLAVVESGYPGIPWFASTIDDRTSFDETGGIVIAR